MVVVFCAAGELTRTWGDAAHWRAAVGLSARLDRSIVVVLLSSWRGCGLAAMLAAAVRGNCTSFSPPSPLPLPLPLKLLRRCHRARASGAARRHAMCGYYRDRDRGSDRDRRPADREESSALRRRGGSAARCSAVTRDGGGCGMAAAAGRGCRAAGCVLLWR